VTASATHEPAAGGNLSIGLRPPGGVRFGNLCFCRPVARRSIGRRIGGLVAIDDYSNYVAREPRELVLGEIIPLVAQAFDDAREKPLSP